MREERENVTGMYVDSVHLSDFRCFRKAKAKFLYPDGSKSNKTAHPNINLILGTNASGKSAVLKAIALSVLAPTLQSSGYVPNFIVRRPSKNDHAPTEKASATSDLILFTESGSGVQQRTTKGQVVVMTKGDRDLVISTAIDDEALWRGIFNDHDPAFFLVAYGATRRVELGEVDLQLRERSRAPRYQKVAGLFEDYVALVPPSTWIKRLDSLGRLEEAVSLLQSVLPPDVQPQIMRTNGEVEIRYDALGTELPFSALADGYRAFIGWVGDLLFYLGQAAPESLKLTDVRGVVIVDEIDLHLHPEWQRIVVDRISQCFPKLQFFLTTHSPLVTASLETRNIWLCETDESGLRSLNRPSDNPFGLSPDQILSSSYFGMMSVRPKQKENDLRELSLKAAEGDSEAAVKFLRSLAGAGSERKVRSLKSGSAEDIL